MLIYSHLPNQKHTHNHKLMKLTTSSTTTSSRRRRSCSVSLLVLMILSSIMIYTTATSNDKTNDDVKDHEQHMKPSWMKSLMSVTETAFPYTSLYLEKGRVAIKLVHDSLFRPQPDIDFRSNAKEGGGVGTTPASKAEEDGGGGGGGVGEKVKEAAGKSLEKSKSTFEESAKLAGATLNEVKEKVKISFEKTQDHYSRPEL